jgi:TolA-binding protein
MRFLIGALAPLSLLLTTPVWGQDYLYQPRPLAQDERPAADAGLLVREVQVKKGDTLSHISKRFSGRGAYYPQILLFNRIKNPHLIYPGDLLRVPVTGQRTAQQQSKPAAGNAMVTPAVKPQRPAEKAPQTGEQTDFNRALAAFKRGDCNEAVKLFDRFIAVYPQSPLLPEATLNRAECYLKQSAN